MSRSTPRYVCKEGEAREKERSRGEERERQKLFGLFSIFNFFFTHFSIQNLLYKKLLKTTQNYLKHPNTFSNTIFTQ